ncbi:MAG: prepilin-type N-terminal cleavage/methylation domain-containing protein [Thioalkalivibrionaceae bacterium]
MTDSGAEGGGGSRVLSTCRRAGAGFALLEVLVAIVILSFSLAAIYQTMAESTRSMRHLQERDQAWQVAVVVARQFIYGRADEVSLSGQTNGFRWQIIPVDVQREQVPAVDQRVAQAGESRAFRVEVSWSGARGNHLIGSEFVRYEPSE